MMSPKAQQENRKTFSIILATYNCGRKIESTVESILAQNSELFDLIIVDGGSTDDTLERLEKITGGKGSTIISEKDSGVYDAFNKGTALATGKYLYFIGAGDRLRKGILQEIVKLLPNDQQDIPLLIYGDAWVVSKQIEYGDEFNKMRIQKENLCHQSAFYGRRLFDMFGNFNERYKIFADWEFNLKCFGDQRVQKKYIDRIIVDFEGGGLSATEQDANFSKDFSRLVIKHLGVKKFAVFNLRKAYSKAYWAIYHPYFRPLIKILRQ